MGQVNRNHFFTKASAMFPVDIAIFLLTTAALPSQDITCAAVHKLHIFATWGCKLHIFDPKASQINWFREEVVALPFKTCAKVLKM